MSDGEEREQLREALEHLLPLSDLRLVIAQHTGWRVLMGPRMEYVVPDRRALTSPVPADVPLLVDPDTGGFLSLDPLVLWQGTAKGAFGRLFVLHGIERDQGHYTEDGVPGSPGQDRILRGRPSEGRLATEPGKLEAFRSPPARFRDDSRLGSHYHISGLIWRGGTSDIYAARRLKDHRPVALKTYESDPGRLDENFWRFVSEERLSQRIRHPFVVVSRRAPVGPWGIVHEQHLASQGSLADLLLANGVIRSDHAAGIALDLLEALAAIHVQGIAHNDIKPDNILFDDDGRLQLIDFGIACEIDSGQRELRPGTRVGSIGYMAPELERAAWPTIASDLYSVGVVLTEMLCGRPLRTPEDVRGVREIPSLLHEPLSRLLAGSPERRFASAPAASRALAAIHPRLVPERGIALDVEGTLVPSYGDHHPRRGLREFLDFCLSHFDRIFVYTLLEEEEAAEVFSELCKDGSIPAAFGRRYEYVAWPRGADGSRKDLRRCRLPLTQIALVDDMALWVPEDQRHRWIRVASCGGRPGVDRALEEAEGAIRTMFGL